jgi:hypothetical protein
MYRAATSYYTIAAARLARMDFSDQAFAHIRLNVLLQDEKEITPELFDTINALPVDHILSLSASLFRDEELLAGICPSVYLLLSMNWTSAGQKIIPVFTNDGTPPLKKMETYFAGQGVTGLEFPVFNVNGPGVYTKDNCTLVLLPQFSQVDKKVFDPVAGVDKMMIVVPANEFENPRAISELRKIMMQAEQDGIGADPAEFYVEKAEFDMEKELWKRRVSVYNDFLPLSKKVQQKEYNDVIDWYHKEYEVLPVWYKRLGHIIKVLMGKREFRSLFGDKLKRNKT